MRKGSSEFITSYVSEAGSFRKNRDYFAYVELDDYACWMVADGIDTDEEINSAETVANSIFSELMENPSMSGRKLKKVITNAHKLLNSESRNVRLKCSLVLCVSDYSKIMWAVCGNARLYHFTKGRYNFASKDQSYAQMMADAGKISLDEIDRHDERGNLTNYVGKSGNFKPFISKKYQLNNQDVIVLCSQGIWENIDRFEMNEALKESEDPEEFVDIVEEFVLGKQKRDINNYTIGAVYANKIFKENNKEKMQLTKKIALISGIVVLALILLIVVFKIIDSVNKAKINDYVNDINKLEQKGDEYVKNGQYDRALEQYTKAVEEYEKDVKASSELKEKKSEEVLTSKEQVATQLVNGDNSYIAGEYDNALKNYINARQEAAKANGFYTKDLDLKIAGTKDIIRAKNLENSGDIEASNENNINALDKYKEAYNIAVKSNLEDLKKELLGKINEIKAKITDKDKQKVLSDANVMIQSGDQKAAAKDYEGALGDYNSAKAKITQVDGDLSSVSQKIDYVTGVAAIEQNKAAQQAKN